MLKAVKLVDSEDTCLITLDKAPAATSASSSTQGITSGAEAFFSSSSCFVSLDLVPSTGTELKDLNQMLGINISCTPTRQFNDT